MVHVYTWTCYVCIFFVRFYQNLESGMWNNSNSTFLRIHVSIGQIDNNNINYSLKTKDYEKT